MDYFLVNFGPVTDGWTDTETDNTALYTIKNDNEHAKSSCTPPNWYKAMLCTTKEYVGNRNTSDRTSKCQMYWSQGKMCSKEDWSTSAPHISTILIQKKFHQ